MSEQEESTDEESSGEDHESSESVEALRERVDELEAERDELATLVEELETERDDLESRLKRTAADFDNYKKRQERRREELRETATEELVERLLDVRENLKRALDQETTEVDSLREGVKLTLTELDRVFDAEGVSEIEPTEGTPVDPQRHEVMLRVDSDQPEGHIAEVYQRGYIMGEKVLRPAQVTVSDGPTGDSPDESTPDENSNETPE